MHNYAIHVIELGYGLSSESTCVTNIYAQSYIPTFF